MAIGASAAMGGTQVTGGSAQTKGSYAQLSAALPFPVDGFWLCVNNHDAGYAYNAGQRWSLDLAIGAASGEVIVVADVMITTFGQSHSPTNVFVPLYLPAGQRLSARIASNSSSQVLDVWILARQASFGSPKAFTRCYSYGAGVGGAGIGTVVDPGATADTKGAWTLIASDVVPRIRTILFEAGHNGNNLTKNASWQFDVAFSSIGVGPGEDLIRELPSTTKGVDNIAVTCVPTPGIQGPYPVYFSGNAARDLYVRAACSINDATDRLADVAIYGLE